MHGAEWKGRAARRRVGHRFRIYGASADDKYMFDGLNSLFRAKQPKCIVKAVGEDHLYGDGCFFRAAKVCGVAADREGAPDRVGHILSGPTDYG